MNCQKCGNNIPKKRVEMGYSTCVDCSTESKWSGHLVVFHKTGNTYDIIKDPETAAIMASMSNRNGFGSKRKTVAKEGKNSVKKITPAENKNIDPSVIKRIPPDPSKWEDEAYTLAILDKLTESANEALQLLNKVFAEGKISPIARKRLLVIISANNP